MAENVHDSPATYEENLQYLKDPYDPKSKPYSTRQVAANQASGGKVFLYHEIAPKGRIFDREEVEDAIEDGWVDTPYVHPNNPEHQAPEPMSAKDLTEFDAIKVEAEKLGITVDKRWGLKRLREEIVKASG